MAMQYVESNHGTPSVRDGERRANVRKAVQQRLSMDCPYWYYFREVRFEFDEGGLTLRGRVPTFHLKQILQTLLRDVDGVTHIDNQVDVTSSSGLSSVRDEGGREL